MDVEVHIGVACTVCELDIHVHMCPHYNEAVCIAGGQSFISI